MYEGASREGPGVGGNFGPLTIGTLYSGDGITEYSGYSRLFPNDNPPFVGLGNTVLLYINMVLLEPRDPAGAGIQDVKFIDVTIQYACLIPPSMLGGTAEPRFPTKTVADIFPTSNYFNSEVVSTRGRYRDGVKPSVAGYSPPKQATNVLYHRWPVHRINNPADIQYSSPDGALAGSTSIPVIIEYAVGDQIDARFMPVPADEDQSAIMRVGEAIQASVCSGGFARG